MEFNRSGPGVPQPNAATPPSLLLFFFNLIVSDFFRLSEHDQDVGGHSYKYSQILPTPLSPLWLIVILPQKMCLANTMFRNQFFDSCSANKDIFWHLVARDCSMEEIFHFPTVNVTQVHSAGVSPT